MLDTTHAFAAVLGWVVIAVAALAAIASVGSAVIEPLSALNDPFPGIGPVSAPA